MKKTKGRRYFLYVNIFKFFLIAAFVSALVTFIAYIYYSDRAQKYKSIFEKSEIKKRSIAHDIMENPVFYDFNKEGKKFFIRAKSAKKGENIIEMQKIMGDFKLDKNKILYFKARAAKILLDKNIAQILGHVNITSNQNEKMDAIDVVVEYKKKIVSSEKPVDLYTDFGSIKAKGFEIIDNNIMNFKGPVKTIILEKNKNNA